MANIKVTEQFADRLRDTMIAAGFTSHRSISGVSVHKLAKITGYSVQICRKYLRGEAMPEYSKLVEIAEELKVSPGWLAFGDSINNSEKLNNKVIISKETLYYIITKSSCLPNNQLAQQEYSDFLVKLVSTLNLINGTDEQNQKIIDLAFASKKYFNSDS